MSARTVSGSGGGEATQITPIGAVGALAELDPASVRNGGYAFVEADLASIMAGDGGGQLRIELGWGDTNTGCSCARVQSPVPGDDDEAGVADGQGAGEVDGVRASKGVQTGQLAGMLFYGCGELDRPGGRPVTIPGALGRVEFVFIEVVVAGGGGKRGTHLGIGQPARDGGVTSVPQFGGKLAACLLGEEFHEGAGVEVDEWHLSAPLFADDVGHGPARTRTSTPGCFRALDRCGSANHPFGRQALKCGRGRQAEQPGDRDAAVGDDDFVTFACSFEPFAEVCAEISDGHIHSHIVHSAYRQFVQVRAPGRASSALVGPLGRPPRRSLPLGSWASRR